jgi:hypothetical protein
MLAQQAPLFGFLRMAVIYLASEDGMILITVEERLGRGLCFAGKS